MVNKVALVMVKLADEIVEVKNVKVIDIANAPQFPIKPDVRQML